jgi:hypothetical protein
MQYYRIYSAAKPPGVSPGQSRIIGAAFVVKDSARQKLGYFYFEKEPDDHSAIK